MSKLQLICALGGILAIGAFGFWLFCSAIAGMVSDCVKMADAKHSVDKNLYPMPNIQPLEVPTNQ